MVGKGESILRVDLSSDPHPNPMSDRASSSIPASLLVSRKASSMAVNGLRGTRRLHDPKRPIPRAPAADPPGPYTSCMDSCESPSVSSSPEGRAGTRRNGSVMVRVRGGRMPRVGRMARVGVVFAHMTRLPRVRILASNCWRMSSCSRSFSASLVLSTANRSLSFSICRIASLSRFNRSLRFSISFRILLSCALSSAYSLTCGLLETFFALEANFSVPSVSS
mmetsp:Transcript_34914/g.56511  ORF Transcript_34914/g.56511 Transcript_34914/m.56511 type:complete len:222 (-) Transcript_34914:1441-2106(-)